MNDKMYRKYVNWNGRVGIERGKQYVGDTMDLNSWQSIRPISIRMLDEIIHRNDSILAQPVRKLVGVCRIQIDRWLLFH